jgi:hypothetical protein
LDKSFICNERKVRKSKLEKMIQNCRRTLGIAEFDKLASLLEYVEKNPKCKIPWSDMELKMARQHVLEKMKDQEAEFERDQNVCMMPLEVFRQNICNYYSL